MVKKVTYGVLLLAHIWWAAYLPFRSFYPQQYPPLKPFDMATIFGMVILNLAAPLLCRPDPEENPAARKVMGLILNALLILPLLFVLVRFLFWT